MRTHVRVFESSQLEGSYVGDLLSRSFIFPDHGEVGLCKRRPGTSLVVQWLRLCAPNAQGLGSIPGQVTKSHMLQLKDPARCNKYPTHGNEDSHLPQLRPDAAK